MTTEFEISVPGYRELAARIPSEESDTFFMQAPLAYLIARIVDIQTKEVPSAQNTGTDAPLQQEVSENTIILRADGKTYDVSYPTITGLVPPWRLGDEIEVRIGQKVAIMTTPAGENIEATIQKK